MENKPSLSIPYQKHYWLMRLSGPPVAVLGIWSFFFFFVEFWDGGIGFWLVCGVPMVVFSAFMGVYGLKITFESFLMVHMVPEGIAVTVFGRNLRLYPVERIQCQPCSVSQSHTVAILMLLSTLDWMENSPGSIP